ncbi:MAG: T9SS type A sorting domain-containing protein [Cytophagaceae bacterium]|nr:T9SS type A sorting domain-containing protein [Cytophagaceae bacterium]
MKQLLPISIFSLWMTIINVSAQPLYTEQFDLSATPVNFTGTNAANISATRIGSYGACGEVKIENTAAFSNGFQAFNYDFPSPVTITNASDAIIKIRLRTASSIPLRLAFRGDNGTGVKNLSCVWAAQQKTFTGDINTYQELTFTYSAANDLNVSGCSGTALTFPASLAGIAININSGSTTFTNPIYIDYVSVGATSPSSGNATCKTDIATGTPADPLFVQQFDPNELNQTAMTGTEITSGSITTARAVASSGANCGELHVQNASGNLTVNYSTINYDTMLTLPANTDAVIRVRAKVTNGTSVPVRAIFRGKAGGASTVNLSNVWSREQKSLAGDGQWHELVFYYGFSGDLNSSGAAGTAHTFPNANLDGIGIAFYTGATAVTPEIAIDYIAVGNTPTSCILAANKKSVIASSVEVYPVPAENTLHIDTHGAINKAQVKLMNSMGVLMKETEMTSGEATIDVASLESGLYFLSIYDGSEIIKIEKVIIK